MSQNQKVTIICSCFNHEKYVVECLESVCNQTYPNIQIIVIDDCSNDNSVSVIEEFIIKKSDIIFIKNPKNLGITKSVTKAMHFVEGDFFIDLAADDILMPRCVELLLHKFQNSTYPNLALVYGNAEEITENGEHLKFYFETDSNKKLIHNRPTGNIYKNVISPVTTICSVSALYKKTIFDNLGGYNENYAYEDLDYWIRASRSFNIDFLDEIVVKKRILSSSLHSSFVKKHSFIGKSTYLIFKNASKLNQTKEENKFLSQSVFYELKKSVKAIDLGLTAKNGFLWLLLRLRSI